MFNIYIGIRLTPRAIGTKASLFYTIKWLLEARNNVGVILIKTKWLFHVDFFIQVSMYKGDFDIHLMHFPTLRSNEWKSKLEQIHVCNRGKSLWVINTFNLWETFGNMVGFKLIHASICWKLGFVYPFATKNLGTLKKRSKIISVIFQ